MVYDPSLEMAVDVFPYEDGQAQARAAGAGLAHRQCLGGVAHGPYFACATFASEALSPFRLE